LPEEKVFGHQRLNPAGSEECAQAGHQVKEEQEYVLHGDSLRSVVVARQADRTRLAQGIYQFAIHEVIARQMRYRRSCRKEAKRLTRRVCKTWKSCALGPRESWSPQPQGRVNGAACRRPKKPRPVCNGLDMPTSARSNGKKACGTVSNREEQMMSDAYRLVRPGAVTVAIMLASKMLQQVTY
jgi:hypothetical protein